VTDRGLAGVYVELLWFCETHGEMDATTDSRIVLIFSDLRSTSFPTYHGAISRDGPKGDVPYRSEFRSEISAPRAGTGLL